MTKVPEDRKSASVLGLTEKWWSDKLKEVLESFLLFGVSRLTKLRGFSACESMSLQKWLQEERWLFQVS
ncbi:hypothetical protein BV898_02264 [Hypsibius exemplaris]|uniref:Uncharacterized protein n=1 Tax=Hypsibius exemplaris TaxID=2072580 RepID=A0A1W0X8P4_HYPEX|nr:hypothetical protein BV898_02264 [Hypsibius exemplaris]